MSTSHKPLSKRTLFYYGLADMPIQMASIPVAAYVPNYYGADLGVSLAAVGTILLLSRAFDAVTDPLIGWLSDRTHTRWGRRRVWMALSVPLLMISVYKLFMPEPPVTPGYLLFWLVVLWAGWTMLFIPYYAWAAELSPDYNERTRITGWRSSLGLAANVLSMLVPAFAIFLFGYGGSKETLLLIGTMMLVLLPITVGLTIWKVPESGDYVPARMPVISGLKLMWNNHAFRRLMLAFFVNQLGSSISTALIVFYIRGVLQEEQNSIVQLSTFYGFNLLGIPFWVKYAGILGKHRAWCVALAIFSVLMLYYLLLGPGDFLYMLPVTAITGFLGGAFWVIPNSMKADVIDVDRLESGEDRAAWFFAVWSFATKVALAVGPWLALLLLAAIGFNPHPGADNGEDAMLGLKLLFVFGPATGFLLSAIIAWGYPLTETKHREVQAALAARGRSGAGTTSGD
ncbi:MAG: MFS transporter [Pseudomonadales bacterium]|nr:MFS transporter [Pseudomonadales bacterium]